MFQTLYAGTLVAGLLFGSSLGTVATATHVRLVARAGSGEAGAANSLFNLGFNAGFGVGGVLFGVVARATGYGWTFALGAVWLCGATALFLADRTRARERHER